MSLDWIVLSYTNSITGFLYIAYHEGFTETSAEFMTVLINIQFDVPFPFLFLILHMTIFFFVIMLYML